MHLKSLRIQGFKTFARKTEMVFGRGVTGIVGPNGSGKSNLVDAIRWALGEKSARGLRGQRMEDVIFAGGPGRAPMGMAEVSLLIDNADGRVPLEFGEIEVARRLYRSGESDYFINSGRARLRDIEGLLAHTGLTQDGYAIVAQDDIDYVIQAPPAVRRSILEEAAGVRVVRLQHSEARQRLADARANLQRAQDVLLEITPRVEELRSQAERAQEAERLQHELARLQGSLQLDRWRKAKAQLRKAEQRRHHLEDRLSEAAARAAAAQERYEACKLEVRAAQQARLTHQGNLGTLRVRLAGLEGQRALARERVGVARAGRTEALAALQELGRKVQAAAAVQAQVESEIQTTGERIDALRAEQRSLAEQARVEQARRILEAESQLVELRPAAEKAATWHHTLELERAAGDGTAAEADEGVASARGALESARAHVVALTTLRDRARPGSPSPLLALGGLRLREALEVEPPYLAAVEAALERELDAWLSSSLGDAGAAIEAIASRKDARETLLFTEPAAAPRPEPEWANHPGVIGPARRFVTVPPVMSALVDRLLSRVWLVEDRRTALALHTHAGAEVTWVTPAGELVTRDRYVGGKAADRVLALEGEVRMALRAEEAAAEELREAAAAREEARRRRDALEEPLRVATREDGEAADRLARAERQLGALKSASPEGLLDSVGVRRLQLSAELTRYEHHSVQLQQQHARMAAERAQLDRESIRLQERTAALEAQDAASQREAVALDTTIAQERQALALAEEQQWDEAEAVELQERLRGLEAEHIASQVAVAHAQDAVVSAETERQAAAEAVAAADAELPEASREEGEGDIEVDWQRTEREVGRVLRRIEALGAVNPLAPAEYEQTRERANAIGRHVMDLEAAIADLQGLMTRLQREIDQRFTAVFQAVAYSFQEHFTELFDGGRATLRLESPPADPDAESVEEPGVEILAQTPGKRFQALTLLSGGERALTALAFIFAVQRINPSPFYVLDEVDAALDDANVARFNKVLTRLAGEQQFLIVTHNHSTMARADVLYGVTLGDHGISKMVSVRLTEVPTRLQEQTA